MRLLATLLGFLFFAGCEGDQPPAAELDARLASTSVSLGERLSSGAAGSGILVQLAFEPAVDLDLYVTGPLMETVYFANHTSKSGGEILQDVRCDTEGERIEKVIFRNPMPGRYRIGIDFPNRCGGDNGPAAYALLVEHTGDIRRKTGTVNREQFDVAVLEFEIE